MLTSRFTRPFVGTALAAGALGIAAMLAAGTANASAADDQYLHTLQQQGISFSNPQSAIGVGHHVCDSLGQGMEPSDISQHLVGANPQLDSHTAVVIVVDSAMAYCPQFVHHMANGTTVVGPNH